jgi:hypothetical protein
MLLMMLNPYVSGIIPIIFSGDFDGVGDVCLLGLLTIWLLLVVIFL